MVTEATVLGLQTGSWQTKLRAGGYYHDVRIELEEGKMFFYFGYNASLLKEIKESFEGRRYHGFIEGDGRKVWSAPITARNLFQLEALQGKYCPVSPYSNWKTEADYTDKIVEHCKNRDITPMGHQVEMVNLGLRSHWFLWAAEMGTGKTLSAILLCEMFGLFSPGELIWVGPKSALVAAKAEFHKWKTKLKPLFVTYDGLKKLVKNWVPGDKAPKGLVLDESSRCKTPTSQRSQAAKHVADSMREDWGWEKTVIAELSGTPAPKTPSDWWMQCEIACPGYLREANIFLFRQRLAHVTKEETTPGAGAYLKLKTWKDSSDKCDVCGELRNHANHLSVDFLNPSTNYHEFKPGNNEVDKLGTRMGGLVGIWLKQDCLDLPKKRYEIKQLQPSQETLNAAKLIVQNSVRAVDALIRLRTLSDGFLYEESPTGEYQSCQGCSGSGKIVEYFEQCNPGDLLTDEEVKGGFRYIYEETPPDEDSSSFIPSTVGKRSVKFESRSVDCRTCEGSGQIEKKERRVKILPCPKIDLLKAILEEHDEIGRLNVYAGFQGSVDRVAETCLGQGWSIIKADGRGW